MLFFWTDDPGRGIRPWVPGVPRGASWPQVASASVLLIVGGLAAALWPAAAADLVPRILGGLLAGVGLAFLAGSSRVEAGIRPLLRALPPSFLTRVMAAEGAVLVALGLVAVFLPQVVMFLAVIGVALWALLGGVTTLVAVLGRGVRSGQDAVAGLLGLLGILAGVSLLSAPAQGAASLAAGFGILAAISGVVGLVEAWPVGQGSMHAPEPPARDPFASPTESAWDRGDGDFLRRELRRRERRASGGRARVFEESGPGWRRRVWVHRG